jgi:hypothetical protein
MLDKKSENPVMAKSSVFDEKNQVPRKGQNALSEWVNKRLFFGCVTRYTIHENSSFFGIEHIKTCEEAVSHISELSPDDKIDVTVYRPFIFGKKDPMLTTIFRGTDLTHKEAQEVLEESQRRYQKN